MSWFHVTALPFVLVSVSPGHRKYCILEPWQGPPQNVFWFQGRFIKRKCTRYCIGVRERGQPQPMPFLNGAKMAKIYWF